MDRPAESFLAAARAIAGEKPPVPDGGSGAGGTPQTITPRGFEEAVLQGELENVRRATEGSRNATLNQAAFNLAQVMPVDTWHSELMSAAVQSGLGRTEAANTIKSAMAGAARNPRGSHRMPGSGPVRPVETLPSVDNYQGEDADPLAGLNIIDWAALEADQGVLEWLCEPFLPVGALVALYSPPGVGKSLLSLDVAVAIATGGQVLGVQCRQARTIYLDYENTGQDVKDRLHDMGRMGLEGLQNLLYASFPTIPPLDTPEGGQALLEAVRATGAAFVVIDTVSRAISGDENEARTWLALYRCTLMPLKREGVTVLRLDHTGKDESKGQRGSSAKSGDVDLVWKLDELVDGTAYVLTCEKHRMKLAETRLNVRREHDPLTHQVSTQTVGQTKADAIRRALDDAGVPRTAGRDVCRRALDEAGLKVSNEFLAKIVKERQAILAVLSE